MVRSVPVVVLFTKFDALVPVALGELAPADRRLPIQERSLKVKPLIEGIFNRADVWGRLSKMTYPPKSCVRMGGLYHFFMYAYCVLSFIYMLGMHRSNGSCNSLLETTAAALGEETLQMLIVSAQETNIALCINYAVQQCVIKKKLLVLNRLTLKFECRVISNVEKVYSSTLPIHNMGKIEFHKLAFWFPHIKVREYSLFKFCVTLDMSLWLILWES